MAAAAEGVYLARAAAAWAARLASGVTTSLQAVVVAKSRGRFKDDEEAGEADMAKGV